MTHILQELSFYQSYPFVRYALIVGVLIALCSSLLGVTLVLKRFSFIGDGLSHVAFGAMAVATIFKLVNNTIFIMPVTIIAAVLLLRTGQNTKIKGDAAIAMLSVSALAVGYLVMNIFSTSANVSGDVCSTLFGSTTILTLTEGEVISCIIMSCNESGRFPFNISTYYISCAFCDACSPVFQRCGCLCSDSFCYWCIFWNCAFYFMLHTCRSNYSNS